MEEKPSKQKNLKKTTTEIAVNSEKVAPKSKVSYEYKGKVYEDEDVVGYFKQEHFLYKIENKLLGEFDSNGKYNIPNDILSCLVSFRKVATKKQGQNTFLRATCGSFTLFFKLEIGVISKGQSFAQLFLVEKAAYISGDEKIEIISPIVFYTDDSDAFFETKVKKIFNILSEEDVTDGKEKENDVLAASLLEKIKIMGKMYERFLLETRLRDRVYLEKLLKILSQDSNGALILKKYEELIKLHQKVLDPSNKNYYRILRQLIDEVLLEQEKNTSFEVALLIQKLRKLYVLANEQTIETVKAPEVKTEAKKEGKIKSASGSGPITFKYNLAQAGAKSTSKKYNSAYITKKQSSEKKSSSTQVSKNSMQYTNEIAGIFVEYRNKYEKELKQANDIAVTVDKNTKKKLGEGNEMQ